MTGVQTCALPIYRTVTRKRRAAYAREVGRRILAPLMYRVAGCLAGLTAILATGVVLANHALPEQLLWWLATGALSAFVLFAVSAAVVWLVCELLARLMLGSAKSTLAQNE